MGSSWVVLGGLWGVTWATFLGALGGVLGALRLQRPFREQFSLNLCCVLGGPNLEKYRFYLRKNDDFQKIAVLLLGCLWDPSWTYFGMVLASKIEVLRGLGQVWGDLGWGWVECCEVLCGLVWSWVVLGEVLGGFWRPDRSADRSTMEGQGLPRGVRGARGARGPPGRQKASPRAIQEEL